MTIFDFFTNKDNGVQYKDDYGNIYLQDVRFADLLPGAVELDGETCMIPKESIEKNLEIEIIVTDDESINYIEDIRRPYYRMRGVPVTRGQAFDIIRRTDKFFCFEIDSIREKEEFLGSMNFDNWLIMQNHYPDGYGWIHVDGTVGTNGITQKYPTVEEFVIEWFRNIIAFPYLDLVIAVTEWNELPPEVWSDDLERLMFSTAAYDERFYDAVILGVYVHDNKIEILNRQDAIIKYKEYNERYGGLRQKYESDYYMENNITQLDLPYLKRCIAAYGLNADEELQKIPEYVWKR